MLKNVTLLAKTIMLIISLGVIEAFGQDDSGAQIERLNIVLEIYNRHFIFYISKMVDEHQAYWETDYKREVSVDSLIKKRKAYRVSDSTYLVAKAFGVKQNVRSTYMSKLKKNLSLKETTSLVDLEFRKEFDDENLPASFYDEVHEEIKRIKVLDN